MVLISLKVQGKYLELESQTLSLIWYQTILVSAVMLGPLGLQLFVHMSSPIFTS